MGFIARFINPVRSFSILILQSNHPFSLPHHFKAGLDINNCCRHTDSRNGDTQCSTKRSRIRDVQWFAPSFLSTSQGTPQSLFFICYANTLLETISFTHFVINLRLHFLIHNIDSIIAYVNRRKFEKLRVDNIGDDRGIQNPD